MNKKQPRPTTLSEAKALQTRPSLVFPKAEDADAAMCWGGMRWGRAELFTAEPGTAKAEQGRDEAGRRWEPLPGTGM